MTSKFGFGVVGPIQKRSYTTNKNIFHKPTNSDVFQEWTKLVSKKLVSKITKNGNWIK